MAARCATMRASSARTTCRVSLPSATSAGSPVAAKRGAARPAAPSGSGSSGPGRLLVECRTRSVRPPAAGSSGWPSRTVSRKPCIPAVNARSRITSALTRLMPILMLIRSAGVSRIVRATNGSSSALPPKPRLTRSTPPSAAARAGQVVVGLAASEPGADRAAVVQPDPAPAVGRRLDRRRPCAARRARSSRCAAARARRPSARPGVRRTAACRARRAAASKRPLRHVDDDRAAAGHAALADEPAVDDQVVDAVGSRRDADVHPLGGEGVQLDGGGRGAEGQAYAGGLALRHQQLGIGHLGARPGRQPVGEQRRLGLLQLDGARTRSAVIGVEVSGMGANLGHRSRAGANALRTTDDRMRIRDGLVSAAPGGRCFENGRRYGKRYRQRLTRSTRRVTPFRSCVTYVAPGVRRTEGFPYEVEDSQRGDSPCSAPAC